MLVNSIGQDPLRAFVRESNKIEGITRAPTAAEIEAHMDLVLVTILDVSAVVRFVRAVQPDARLRDEAGLNVRVGRHVPPCGGPEILPALEDVLRGANVGEHPYAVHQRYETLHPFTDGNGRSGRAIWLWQMLGQPGRDPYALERGFLHSWYYQSLQRGRA